MKINKIKNKLLKSLFLRLPGGDYFNKLLLTFKDVITLSPTIENWYILKTYFLGSKHFENYLKYLENKYLDKDKSLFDFKIIKIPKTETYEKGGYLTFWLIFFDVIYPEIYHKNSLWSLDGPYFNKKVEIKKGDIVIDAGANIGMFSALAVSRGAQKLYAFEPVEWIINENLKPLLNLYNNIEIIPLALLDKKCVKEMNIVINPLFIGISSFFVTSYVKEAEEYNIIKKQVQAISLDEWVKENKIPRIDFIKADIEGAERLLLKGAKEVLKEFAPKISICTYHLVDDKEILPKLILEANPKYKIILKWKKLYAYV